MIATLFFLYIPKTVNELTICLISGDIDFLEKNPSEKKSADNQAASLTHDLIRPSFFVFDFEKQKFLPNYFILKDYSAKDNTVTFVLKKNIISNRKIGVEQLTDYFADFGAYDMEFQDGADFIISMKINSGIDEFMIKNWIKRPVVFDENVWKGLFDFKYSKSENVVSLEIEAGKNNTINIKLFFYKDKFEMYKEYVKNEYDIAFNFSDNDVNKLGNIVDFNVITQSRFNYYLFLNTRRLDYSTRSCLFDKINKSISDFGNQMFIKSNQGYINNFVFEINNPPRKNYTLGVYEQNECIQFSKLLSRYLSLSNVFFDNKKIMLNDIAEFIKQNEYDLILAPMIEIYNKERLNLIWGAESLNKFNFSNYIPDLIKSGGINKLSFEECKSRLAKELFENKICIELSYYNNPVIVSNKFSAQQIEAYKRNIIIYSLLK